GGDQACRHGGGAAPPPAVRGRIAQRIRRDAGLQQRRGDGEQGGGGEGSGAVAAELGGASHLAADGGDVVEGVAEFVHVRAAPPRAARAGRAPSTLYRKVQGLSRGGAFGAQGRGEARPPCARLTALMAEGGEGPPAGHGEGAGGGDGEHPGPDDAAGDAQRTADQRCTEPTPTMAPVMVWVVETGMPSQLEKPSAAAPAVSALKPPMGLSLVMRPPMVRTIRQPPSAMPKPMPSAASATTQSGTAKVGMKWAANRAVAMMPMVFCASLVPCARLSSEAETSWPLRKNRSTRMGWAR